MREFILFLILFGHGAAFGEATPFPISNSRYTLSTISTAATVSIQQFVKAGGSGNYTVTLPTASGQSGKSLVVQKTQSNTATIVVDGNGAETISGASNLSLDFQYETLTIISDGTNWQILQWYIPVKNTALTCGGPSGWASSVCQGTIIKTNLGATVSWRLMFNVSGTHNSIANGDIAITGVVFNLGGERQSVSCNDNSGGSAPSNNFVDATTGNIHFDFAANNTNTNCSGNVLLSARPSLNL